MDTRSKLIKKGVDILQKHGYPSCSKENIMSDLIYSAFFRESLVETQKVAKDKTLLKTIQHMLDEIEILHNAAK